MDDETTEAPTKKQFEGFRKIDKESKNFYGIPNEWTDIMAEIDNLAELKIIEYIMRHTWGFKEHDTLKCITTDEFAHGRKRKDGTRMDKGTGLGTTGVKQGITKAVEHGYVICETDESDKGRIKKHYGLKMLPTPDLDRRDATMHSHEATTDSRNATPDSRNETTHSREETGWISQDDHRSEKETLEKHLEKNTDERTNGTSRETSPVATSDESFIHSSNFSSSSFSSQEKPSAEKPKVTLTEDEQRIVDFGKKDIFKAVKPQVTQKLKDECAELAPHIKTQEQFDSLLAYVKGKLKPPYHLKNMVNALNDWLQTQEKKPLKVKDLATRPFRDLGAYQREIERQYYEKQAAIAKKKAEQAGC